MSSVTRAVLGLGRYPTPYRRRDRRLRSSRRAVGTLAVVGIVVLVVAAGIVGGLYAAGKLTPGAHGGGGPLPSYSIQFVASGLPSDGSWSVNLAGTNTTSTASSVSFSEPNGSYAYAIYAGTTLAAPSSGFANVSGANVSVPLTFTPAGHIVTFRESGLPAGDPWTVEFNNSSVSSSATLITFAVPNGIYAFSASSVGYLASPASGTLNVSGSAVAQSIQFSPPPRTVTVTEAGLPNGTSWYVALGDQTTTSNLTVASIGAVTGSVPFEASASGYIATPFAGQIGLAQNSLNLSFVPEQPSSGYVSSTIAMDLAEASVSSTLGGNWTAVALSGFASASSPTIYPGAFENGGNATCPGPTWIGPDSLVLPATPSGAPPGTASTWIVGLLSGTTEIEVAVADAVVVPLWNQSVPGDCSDSLSGISPLAIDSSTAVVAADAAGGFAFQQSHPAAPGANWTHEYDLLPHAPSWAGGATGYVWAVRDSVNYAENQTVVAFGATVPTRWGPARPYPVLWSNVVTVDESGLPNGVPWNLTVRSTLGGGTSIPTALGFGGSGPIVVDLPNGNYTWSIGVNASYTATPSGGELNLSGAGETLTVAFSPTSGTLPTWSASAARVPAAPEGSGGSARVLSSPYGSVGFAIRTPA
ncbi:MAG: hypothetical protein ACREBZ_00600 [Thermoplasmata archaeon]